MAEKSILDRTLDYVRATTKPAAEAVVGGSRAKRLEQAAKAKVQSDPAIRPRVTTSTGGVRG